MTRILVLCTGNSCRSQMAEALLKSFDPSLVVHSAGTHPAAEVHPLAVEVMREVGIEIGTQKPKSVEQFLDMAFDFVLTVCESARETCPAFTGKVKRRMHVGFEDPAAATGSETVVRDTFRRVRDEIRRDMKKLYLENIQQTSI